MVVLEPLRGPSVQFGNGERGGRSGDLRFEPPVRRGHPLVLALRYGPLVVQAPDLGMDDDPPLLGLALGCFLIIICGRQFITGPGVVGCCYLGLLPVRLGIAAAASVSACVRRHLPRSREARHPLLLFFAFSANSDLLPQHPDNLLGRILVGIGSQRRAARSLHLPRENVRRAHGDDVGAAEGEPRRVGRRCGVEYDLIWGLSFAIFERPLAFEDLHRALLCARYRNKRHEMCRNSLSNALQWARPQ